MATGAAASDDSPCFFESWNAHQENRITLESHLRNILAHVFGTRHAADAELNEGQIKYWAEERDMVSAAIMICLLDKDFRPPPPGSADLLLTMILASRSASLSELRGKDQPTSPLLAVPLAYQIILSAAFQHGNRGLVREMIAASATPGHDLLFGCDKGRGHDTDPGQEADFGGTKGYGHGAMKGQVDNGCDLWVDMIRAGWSAPRAYMQCWAATSTSTEAGKRLIEMLRQHDIKVGYSAVLFAMLYHRLDMVDYLLGIYKPTQEEGHNLLLMTAGFKEDGVRALEMLFRRGVRNINWVETGPASMPMAREDKIPRRSPLHVAAGEGAPAVVDWLIRRGAECTMDFFFKDPYQVAKDAGRTDNMKVFERHPGWSTRGQKNSKNRFTKLGY